MTDLKPETKLAILEAFARSKPYEFDGFTARYLEEHPEAEKVSLSVGDYTVKAASVVIEKKVNSKVKKSRKLEASTSNQVAASPAES